MRVALDAFTASAPPDVVAVAAATALEAFKDIRLTLVGDAARLEAGLSAVAGRLRDRITIFPACQSVPEDEPPEAALRFRPDASISRCWQLLAERKVDGLISTASPAVVVAAGMRLRRLAPHVRRPALAAIIETSRGRWLILDAGAFAEAAPAHLYQYGVTGLVLHRVLTGTGSGRCVLLRSEEALTTREADRLLEAGLATAQYAGVIEPSQAFRSGAEVLVCPGKLGGLLLRTGVSVANLLRDAELPGPRIYGPRPLLGFAGHAVVLPDWSGLSEAFDLLVRMEAARLPHEVGEALQFGPLVGAAGEDV